MRVFTAFRSERGSLTFAMLGVLIMGALVTVVMATVVTGLRQTRFDQRFEQSLHVAESGVERLAILIESGALTPADSPRVLPATTLGGGEYSAVAVYEPVARRWVLTAEGSSGGTGGTRRVIGMYLEDVSMFPVGVFADTHLGFNGGNTAWSYDSSTGAAGEHGTGRAAVGTNGTLSFSGVAGANPDNKTVDQVLLYNAAAAPPAGRCTHSGGANCDAPSVVDEALDLEANSRYQELKANCDANGYQPAWTASEHGPIATDGVHCVSELHFDEETVVAPGARAVFFVGGPVSVNANVNCSGCSWPGGTLPVAANLQVYTATTAAVEFANHSNVAGGFYAPFASCEGSPSNAQVSFYGALMCGSIANQGGWNFYYDEALADVGDNAFRRSAWFEG